MIERKWGLIKPSTGVRHNPSHPLTRGLVGHWMLNEGGGLTAYDISNKGNHGTLTGGADLRPGHFGRVVSFDGLTGYISIGSKSGFATGSGATWSLSIWVYSNGATGGLQTIQAYGDFSTSGATPHLVYRSTGQLRLSTWGAGNDLNGSTPAASVWNHFLGTCNGTAITLYVNGNLDAGPFTLASNSPVTTHAAIGNDPVTAGRFLNGGVDEARIYNRYLTADEVRQLYLDPFVDLERPRIFIGKRNAVAPGRIWKLAGVGGGLVGLPKGLAA